MSPVPATFYFDFADARSYLAAVQLSGFVEAHPVAMQLCALEASTLHAFAHEPGVRTGDLGASYARTDAERFARRLGVGLVWPQAPLNTGLAARVVHWLVEHSPEAALDATLRVFDAVWSEGRPLHDVTLRECLDAAGLGSSAILQAAGSADAVHLLEARTELAAAEGVFDVPTLRVGDGAPCVGFDRFDFAARAVYEALLVGVPVKRLVGVLAELLLDAPHETRAETLRRLTADRPVAVAHVLPPVEPLDPRVEALLAAVRTLPAPEPREHLAAAPPAGPIGLRVFGTGSHEPVADGGRLAAMLRDASAGAALFGPAPIAVSDLQEIKGELRRQASASDPGLLGAVLVGGEPAILHLPPASEAGPGHLRAERVGITPDGELLTHILSTGRVVYLTGALARDSIAHRKAAMAGAHVLVLCGVEPGDVIAAGSAVRCGRWVVTLGSELAVYDAHGRGRTWPWPAAGTAVPLELPWPPEHAGNDAARWQAGPARKTLVNEEPLSLGGLESSADIGFAASGSGLMVQTVGLKSYLIATRRFETLRVQNAPVVLIPIFGTHILVSEVLAFKVYNALARGPDDARVLLVNYWSDLSYELLVRVQPAIAATAAAHDAPVLIVAGARPVELWQPEQTGGAHRIEPEGEAFVLDLARQSTLRGLKSRLGRRIEPHAERYLQLLQALLVRG